MIDMRSVFATNEYKKAIKEFNSCNWSIFKRAYQLVSHSKCPICEVELKNSPNTYNSATIDHFRPKNMYKDLKCVPENYLLMCQLCNERYKKAKFPLYDEKHRVTGAKTIQETKNEKPLLFNPAEEEPLHFFELVFIERTGLGGILELKRNTKTISKDKNDYEYQRCQKMIKLFGLGSCHNDIHPDSKSKECRIDILRQHYAIFKEIAQAISDRNEKSLALILKDKNRHEELQKYGFYKFLQKNQFSIK